jgi:eukaryotic translation initiation factor 2C
MSRRGSKPPTEQLSGLSLSVKTVEVDEGPLTMAPPVPPPQPRAMPSNKIDSKTFKIGHHPDAAAQAEFPLRKSFARPDRTVYTNHFVVKLKPKVRLYEYDITGVPQKMNRRVIKSLVREAINSMPILQANRGKFVTDYKTKLVSWIDIGKVDPVSVRTDERKTAVDIGLQ